MAFIDAHRGELGIEPICRELAVAPSSYHEHAVRLADPGRRSARAQRDDGIKEQIRRVHDDSFGLYGTRKVWHQLRRKGIKVAKCTVERLMQAMGLAGIRRGRTTITTVCNPKAPCPLDKVNREFRVSRPNLARPHGHIQLEAAPSVQLGRGVAGSAAAVLDTAAVLFGFEQIGGADACHAAAKAYGLERTRCG